MLTNKLVTICFPIYCRRKKKANIDVWAMGHKQYFNQNHRVLYYNLLTSENLTAYLNDIEG